MRRDRAFTLIELLVVIAVLMAILMPASPASRTIDRSGLNEDDQHSDDMKQMWMSLGLPAWIQYTFDREYRVDTLWVWNANSQLEAYMGFGAKNVTVEYSTDGQTWTPLPDVPPFAQGMGLATYTPGTVVDFGGVAAKHVKLTVTATWGSPMAASRCLCSTTTPPRRSIRRPNGNLRPRRIGRPTEPTL
ncbi:MAG TPA: discoidin domain-containing protein [Sedimentisphaerales bacterium]|nr:discoidin domain-containing protein [Sedimentisphaerales bacterium]